MSHVNYVVFALLMTVGLIAIVATESRVKKLMGLGVFQASVILFYISVGYVKGGKVPILLGPESELLYVNPLPSVLMLTAIVVGVATMAVGLAIIIKIRESAAAEDCARSCD